MIQSLVLMNPATGTSLPIPLLIILGVVIVGCIVFAVVSANIKKKNGKNNKKK